MIGRTVAQYRVTSKLGSGGMGVVYEAEDTRLGRHVALKFLPPEMAHDKSSLERFEREARAASSLNHPGICTVYEVGRHEDQDFIAMELLEGETMAERLRRGSLDVAALLDLGVQIADALESAHAKGIVHRDLKPANIFVNARGQAKLLDFGLAKIERAQAGAEAGSQAQTAIHSGEELTSAGTTLGTVSYMSPEQARGHLTDARTDIFSLGTLLYQMATGQLPFPGETSAVVFEAILNRDPVPLAQVNAALPPELGRILAKALDKDRNLRCQTAAEFKTDLLRLKRDLDSAGRRAADLGDSRAGSAAPRAVENSVAVLYFENLSGAKEDEYFRDGITEDIITELSKIKTLKVFPRPTVLPYRDRPVTPQQVGRELSASFVLGGSLRRAGARLRINAQLMDAKTDFPLWSERFDREMADVFEVQDEIARSIAQALRITLSPQEQAALTARPTDNLQAYDLYLRGKSFARKTTRQDTEFALQMFESAISMDPGFVLAHAAIANACAQYYYRSERDLKWIHRARAASARASAPGIEAPEVLVAEAWILYAEADYEEAIKRVRRAIALKADSEGGYYLAGRALFAAGRYQEVADMAEAAISAAGSDYNVYVPIGNALGALGKKEATFSLRLREMLSLETHLKTVPEDARARVLLAADYASLGRTEEALREMGLAMALRSNETTVLYNAACVYSQLGRTQDALDALRQASNAGFRDASWVRQDPDLAILHGDPEFERLYPVSPPSR